MHPLIFVFQLLGQNLYACPSADNQAIRDTLKQLPDMLDWPDKERIRHLTQALPDHPLEELEYQYSVLFEGQGEMPCPPWGSVYLDKDNMVFAESTTAYRAFLRQHDLSLTTEYREPEDQFGLMLLALSLLLEKGNNDAALELITQHLMPWGGRYLALLASNHVSEFYAMIAKVTQALFDLLHSEFQYSVAQKAIYR